MLKELWQRRFLEHLGPVCGFTECFIGGLFPFFLPILVPHMHPHASLSQAVENNFDLISFSMWAYPLGSLIFGWWGDWMGRPSALRGAMGCILISLLVVLFTPLGTLWTVALWFLALSLFNIGSGGEINGGAIYAVEQSLPEKRGAASGVVCFYSVLGILLSAACAALFSSYPQMAWQWFFVGGAILSASILGGIFLSRKQAVSPSFSIQRAVRVVPSQVVVAFVVASLFGVAYYATFVYFTNVGSLLSGVSQESISHLSVVGLGIYMITLLWSGIQSDKWGIRAVMGAGALAIAGCAPLCFWLVQKGAWGFLVGQGLMALASGLFIGPSHAFMNSLFPARFRYRGIAWTYTMAMTCIGAITPKICHWLSATFPTYSAGWVWISLWGVVAFIIVCQQQYKKRSNKNEDETNPPAAILACVNHSGV